VSKRFVCRLEECPRDGLKAFEVEGGQKVLVATSGSEVYGFQARCPHMDVALEEGFYDGAVITCHQHLWQWDVRTGAAMGEAEAPLQRYVLQQEDGAIYMVEPTALSQAELFAGLANGTREAIARLARRQSFEAGSVIYKPGAPADDLCVLESGRVQFVIGRDDCTSPAGFSLRVGEVFGWAALLEDQPRRIAAATCLEASTVLFINGRQLLEALEADPSAGYVVMRRLAALITRHLTPAGAQ
jgi:toluene monooxygenase system ferredoxin subunit